MKKTLAVSFLLIAAGLAAQTQAAPKGYAYACECTAGKKKCDGLENLRILIKSKTDLEASVGDYEWEFNENFTASLSDEGVPTSYRAHYGRFDIPTKDREYLPAHFTTGDLLVLNAMKAGGVKNEKGVGGGEVAIMNRKTGRVELTYGCDAIRVDSF